MPNTPSRRRRCRICASIGFPSMTFHCLLSARETQRRRIDAGNREIEAIQSFLRTSKVCACGGKMNGRSSPRLARCGKPAARPSRSKQTSWPRHSERRNRRKLQSRLFGKSGSAIAQPEPGLRTKLESILRSPAYSSQLQEQIVTVRNGRYVIPVRTEEKRRVEGIIHGSSSSGATVFMEPLAVLEMNNEMVRLQDEERYEVARILAELTQLIQSSASQIELARAQAAYIELVFAKARFGRDFDCGRPTFSRGPLLSLIKARHPLLEDNLRREHAHVSPVSLDMDANRKVLVISGPNAGGKTVVLKTVGLLALMAQSGIPVPAEEASLPDLRSRTRGYRRPAIDHKPPQHVFRSCAGDQVDAGVCHLAFADPARRNRQQY